MQTKDINKMSNSEIANYYTALLEIENPEPLTEKCMEEILGKALTDYSLAELLYEVVYAVCN